AGNQSQFDFGLAKFCRLRRYSDRAGHCRLTSAPKGKAVDGGDYGFPKILNEIKNVLTVPAGLFCPDSTDRSKFADVCTRDEGFISRARENDSTHGGVITGIFKRRAQLFPGFSTQRIHGLR